MNLRLDNRPDDLGVEGPSGPVRRFELSPSGGPPSNRAMRRRMGSRGLAAACLLATVGCGLVLIYLPSKAVLLFVVAVSWLSQAIRHRTVCSRRAPLR